MMFLSVEIRRFAKNGPKKFEMIDWNWSNVSKYDRKTEKKSLKID